MATIRHTWEFYRKQARKRLAAALAKVAEAEQRLAAAQEELAEARRECTRSGAEPDSAQLRSES